MPLMLENDPTVSSAMMPMIASAVTSAMSENPRKRAAAGDLFVGNAGMEPLVARKEPPSKELETGRVHMRPRLCPLATFCGNRYEVGMGSQAFPALTRGRVGAM